MQKKSMEMSKLSDSVFLQWDVRRFWLKTWKTRQTKTWITQNFQILYHMQGCTMWKSRQVLRLTQKVRRENEPLKTVKLNFAATFCRKFSLRTPCWAHIWVVLHKNWYFLMANRIFIHHSKSNHCQSVNPQFGTQFGTWISHFGHIDFSNSWHGEFAETRSFSLVVWRRALCLPSLLRGLLKD